MLLSLCGCVSDDTHPIAPIARNEILDLGSWDFQVNVDPGISISKSGRWIVTQPELQEAAFAPKTDFFFPEFVFHMIVYVFHMILYVFHVILYGFYVILSGFYMILYGFYMIFGGLAEIFG